VASADLERERQLPPARTEASGSSGALCVLESHPSIRYSGPVLGGGLHKDEMRGDEQPQWWIGGPLDLMRMLDLGDACLQRAPVTALFGGKLVPRPRPLRLVWRKKKACSPAHRRALVPWPCRP